VAVEAAQASDTGGVAVEAAQASDHGGVAVEAAQASDTGGVAVDAAQASDHGGVAVDAAHASDTGGVAVEAAQASDTGGGAVESTQASGTIMHRRRTQAHLQKLYDTLSQHMPMRPDATGNIELHYPRRLSSPTTLAWAYGNHYRDWCRLPTLTALREAQVSDTIMHRRRTQTPLQKLYEELSQHMPMRPDATGNIELHYPRRLPSPTTFAWAYGNYYLAWCKLPTLTALREVRLRRKINWLLMH
jgi:hypothetical protein